MFIIFNKKRINIKTKYIFFVRNFLINIFLKELFYKKNDYLNKNILRNALSNTFIIINVKKRRFLL